jgi:CRISPR-associated endonuclease/helicase Cas3
MHNYSETLFDAAVNPDKHGIQRLRGNLDFPEVANRFRMIPEDTFDVIVRYPEDGAERVESLTDELRRPGRPAREVLRDLQPSMVSLNKREAARLQAQGWIGEIIPGVGLWHGTYDPIRGIVVEDPELIV